MTPLTATYPTINELQELSEKFESWEPQDIIKWAAETYPHDIVTLSSFGVTSGAILHMISQIDNSIPVVFLQTHYHFAETLKLRDQIADLYDLKVENWEVWGGRPEFLNQYPDDLNKKDDLEGMIIPDEAKEASLKTGVDLCCWLNKVEPMRRALKKRKAYMTSLRRDGGTELRKRIKIIEVYNQPNREEPLVKINPMANWDKKKLWRYIFDNEVPVHELDQYGYHSVGCEPCTAKAGGDDDRSGRWQGAMKSECGIHTDKPVDFSI